MSHAFQHPAAVRRALLAWFRHHARPLPWRATRDAYRVWVSEVMLQQTQVAAVIPYYERFISAFPTIERLAEAPLDRVLELWSGLGYYRRARNLHRAAREIVERFGGRFPAEFEQARSLPGVGAYTAGAVLSIAYNLPYTVIDGNIARVIARLLARRGSLDQPPFRREVARELELILSRRKPGDFNQALMQLGQTVCLPRSPDCPRCPLRAWCAAYATGDPERYPAPRPRRATESRYLATALILRNGDHAAHDGPCALMVRGLDEGLLGDLWNFPGAFGDSRQQALDRLRTKMADALPGRIRWGRSSARLRHGITYRAITVDVYPASLSNPRLSDSLEWFPLFRLGESAISQLARKITASFFANQESNVARASHSLRSAQAMLVWESGVGNRASANPDFRGDFGSPGKPPKRAAEFSPPRRRWDRRAPSPKSPVRGDIFPSTPRDG